MSIENSDYFLVENIDSDQRITRFDNWHVCESNNLMVQNSNFVGGDGGINFNSDALEVEIRNNTFEDINAGSDDAALDFSGGTYLEVIIQDNLFENNFRHININPPAGDNASNIVIRRNAMNGTTNQEGVRINDGGGPITNLILENNVVMNSGQQNLYVSAPVGDISVRHNTFYNGLEEEIGLNDAAGDVSLFNNIVFANGTHAAVSAEPPFPPGPLPSENYNLIFNNGVMTESGTDQPITVFGVNTIVGLDPRFVDTTPGSEDLHLLLDSPALQSGLDMGVTDDIEQNPRPNPVGTDPDIGAYEMDGMVIDTEGPLALNLSVHPNPSPVETPLTFSATIDDWGSGDSRIASATYTLYSSDLGIELSGPMQALDDFDSPREDVVANFDSPDEAGVYDLCAFGTDEAGNEGPESCLMLAVFDPDAGFVTGGGWIESPPGACDYDTCDPSSSGRANFGFVSKYKKDSYKPEGNAQFVFDGGGLNFHSTEHDWLVIYRGGRWAQFSGSGLINGEVSPNGEPYRFHIRVGDGGVGGFAPDTFNIRIWWNSAEGDQTVYDLGVDQPLGGGSIIIHLPNNNPDDGRFS
jgi:hypothetical protein